MSAGMLQLGSTLEPLARLLPVVRLLDEGLGGFGLGSEGGGGISIDPCDVCGVPSMVAFGSFCVGWVAVIYYNRSKIQIQALRVLKN